MKRKFSNATSDYAVDRGHGRAPYKRARNYSRRYYRRKPKTPFGDVGGIVGKKLGGALGIPLEDTGRWLGGGIGKALFGSGDYLSNLNAIKMNSIINPSDTPTVISGSSTGSASDSIVIRKCEYIKDIMSSATADTFVSESFNLQPGASQTFPFLANVARNYEEYKIRGMVFHFKSLSGDSTASVQSGLGYVAMATQYDVLDAPFTTKAQIENYSMSQSSKPSKDQMHGIECNSHVNALSHLYVRPAAAAPNSDLRLYDMGKFTIANACPGTSVTLGELWVTYDVELFKPKLSFASGAGLTSRSIRTKTSSSTVDFGLIQVSRSGSIAAAVSSTQATFTGLDPSGSYNFEYTYFLSGSVTTAPVIAVSTGTIQTVYPNNAGVPNSINNVTTGVPAVSAFIQMRIITPSSDGTIVLDVTPGVSTPAATAGITVTLTQLENSAIV